jgi:MFS family permease
VYFLGTGIATVATGFADTPIELALGMAATGLFASIYHPVGIAWLVRHAQNRGKWLGINGVFGSIGVGAAALIAGALTDILGWRYAFIIPGALCAVTGLAMMATVRDGSMTATQTDAHPELEAARSDIVRAFVVLSVTMICSGLVYQCTTLALPKLFQERASSLFGDSAFGVGAAVSAIYLGSAACQILGGHLADRYPLKTVYMATFALQVPAFMIAGSVAGGPIVAMAAVIAMLQTVGIPSESSLLARYTPQGWRATAFGAKFVLSIGVSAAGVPLVALVYGGTGGLAWLMILLAAMAALATLAALTLPGDRCDVGNRRRTSPPRSHLAPRPAE